MNTPYNTKQTLNICACISRSIFTKQKIAKVAAAAEMAGWNVNIIPDFCELAEDKNDTMKEFENSFIAACHERAVRSLFNYAGTQCSNVIDIRSDNYLDELKRIGIDTQILDTEALEKCEQKYVNMLYATPNKWGEDAWYPTIDKDVCAECGKCFDFCPFGVYEMIDDRVRVVHPHNCKNNCPACARNCPAGAIIFPKYERSPINGGVEKEDNAVQLDTKEIYTVALKERLAARRNRFLKK